MPVFISYSHKDSSIVTKIAAHLVKHKANIWIDTWELNVGDSLIARIQEAIQESSALLVMLSKASVQSEWCKKETGAALMRELSEKKVIVLPVLIEDCEVPLFLKDKMYADFRTDFDSGLAAVLDGIARVINPDQSRLRSDDGYCDWACDWGYIKNFFHIRFTIVDCSQKRQATLITEVYVLCNEQLTKRYQAYEKNGLDWIGRNIIAQLLFAIGESEDIRLYIDSQLPVEHKIGGIDPKTNCNYDVLIISRRLGDDNGKAQVVDISEYLKNIRNYIRSVSRQPTKEENLIIQRIIASPV